MLTTWPQAYLEHFPDRLQIVDHVVRCVYEEAGDHSIEGSIIIGMSEHLHEVARCHAQLTRGQHQVCRVHVGGQDGAQLVGVCQVVAGGEQPGVEGPLQGGEGSWEGRGVRRREKFREKGGWGRELREVFRRGLRRREGLGWRLLGGFRVESH